jgi:hypothetical protein
MNSTQQREQVLDVSSSLNILWRREFLLTSVQSYLAAFKGEFDTTGIDSGFPYRQRQASMDFRRITRMNAWEASERFEDKGKGCWGLHDDDIVNGITADLLAAAELLGGRIENRRLSGSPGGIGCDTTALWISLLDGGVGVFVSLGQDEETNEMEAHQRTTIRGARAYRALLELLGYAWISRQLEDEVVKPSHEEVQRWVQDLLRPSVVSTEIERL